MLTTKLSISFVQQTHLPCSLNSPLNPQADPSSHYRPNWFHISPRMNDFPTPSIVTRPLITSSRIWNFNEEAGFSQVLHLDTPRSVVPGSEYGELLVAGGLALDELTVRRNGAGLTEALAAITPLLTLRQLEDKRNASLREKFLGELPSHVSTGWKLARGVSNSQ